MDFVVHSKNTSIYEVKLMKFVGHTTNKKVLLNPQAENEGKRKRKKFRLLKRREKERKEVSGERKKTFRFVFIHHL